MKMESNILNMCIKTITIISLVLIAHSSKAFAQQEDLNFLCTMWNLETYVIDGKKYAPNKKEKEDYIRFKEDMTFISKSEGIEEKGTYILNINDAYIILTNDNGEKIKAYIISISKKSLILTFDVDGIRDLEVHYNSHV